MVCHQVLARSQHQRPAKNWRAFFSVNLARTYKDEAGNYHDSFSGSELLRIAHLADRAYDRVSQLRQAEAANGST